MDNNKNITYKKKSSTFSDSLLCPYHLNPIVYTCKLEECINDTGLCMQCIVDQHCPTYVHYKHGLELLEIFLSNHQVKGTPIFNKDTLTNDLIISSIQGDSNSNIESKSLSQHQNEMNELIYLIKQIITYGSGVLSHEIGYLVEELKKPFKTYKNHLITKKLLKQNAFCSMMESNQNDERLRYFKKIREVIHDTNLNKFKDFNCNYDIKKIKVALSTFSQELKDFIKCKIKAIKESIFEANDAVEPEIISMINSPNPYQQSQQVQQAQQLQQPQIVCSPGKAASVMGEHEQPQSPQKPGLSSRLLGQNSKEDRLLSPKDKPERKAAMMIGLEFGRGLGIGIRVEGGIGQGEKENGIQGSTQLPSQGNDWIEIQDDNRLRPQCFAQLQAQGPSQSQAQAQESFQAQTQEPAQAPTMQGKCRLQAQGSGQLQAQGVSQVHTQSTDRLHIPNQISSPTLQAIDLNNKPSNTSSPLPLHLMPQTLKNLSLMSSLDSPSPQVLIKPGESAISLEQASFEQALLNKTSLSQTLFEPSLPQPKDNLLKKKLQRSKSTQRHVKRTILDQNLEKKPNEEAISSSAQSSHVADSQTMNDSSGRGGCLEDQDNNTVIIKDVMIKKHHIAEGEGNGGVNGGNGSGSSNHRGGGGDASGSNGGSVSSRRGGGEGDAPVDDIKIMTYNNGKEFSTNGDAIAYCKQLIWGFNNNKKKNFICLCTVDISKNLKFIYLGETNDICTLVRDPNDTKNYMYQDDILNIPITNLTNIIKITTNKGPKLLTLHLTQINLWDIDINTRKLKRLIKKDLKYHIECHTVLFDKYLFIGYYNSSNQISKIRVFDIQHNKVDLFKECQTSFDQLIKAIQIFKPDLEQFNDNENNDTSSNDDSKKIREEPINSLTNGKKARSPSAFSIFTPPSQALSQGWTLSQSLLLPKPSFISQSLLPSLISTSTPTPPSSTVSTKTKEILSAKVHTDKGNKSIRLISINSKGILFIHEVSLSPTTSSPKKYKPNAMNLVKSDQILNINKEQKDQKPKQKDHHKHNQEQYQHQQEDQSYMMIFSSSRCLDHVFLTHGNELYCFHVEKMNKVWRINISQPLPLSPLLGSNQSQSSLGNLEDLEGKVDSAYVQDVIVLDAALQSMLIVVNQKQLVFYNMRLNSSNIPEFNFHQLIKDIDISDDKNGPKFQIIHNPDTEKTLIYLLLLSKNKNLIWYQMEIKAKVKTNGDNGNGSGNGDGGTSGVNGDTKEINNFIEENLGLSGDTKPK